MRNLKGGPSVLFEHKFLKIYLELFSPLHVLFCSPRHAQRGARGTTVYPVAEARSRTFPLLPMNKFI
jgi:hypothetical protein